MITEIFARRYASVELRTQYFQEDRMHCSQLWTMLSSGLLWDAYLNETISNKAEAAFKAVHDVLALELGVEYLSDRWWFRTIEHNGNKNTQAHTNSYSIICKNFLTKQPTGVAEGDSWMKERLSLIELAFAMREQQVAVANSELPDAIAKAEIEQKTKPARGFRLPGTRADSLRAINMRLNDSFNGLVGDLNERFRLAHYRLTYHNRLIQLSDDAFVSTHIEQPFWTLVGAPPWENIDRQMKEAFDCRDTGDRMAAFHAVSALESCIKIISDTKGWTTGDERGAAAYVSNLVSKKNGGFLEVWEGEFLTKLFSEVRNPFAHGARQEAMPTLTAEQTNWTLDTSMSWIKTLVRRI
tara:strand:- start:1994 stop:3055 length:1062 start_codon:yes stop_codon:yes gene_type:complete